jgi:hypothetical protein
MDDWWWAVKSVDNAELLPQSLLSLVIVWIMEMEFYPGYSDEE